MPSCATCGAELEKVETPYGAMWRAAGGTAWCEARGPWKRHRTGEDATKPLPRIDGRVHKPGECPRPEKVAMTRAAAKDEERRMQARNHPDIVAYLCACNAWHVGKSQDRLAKRARFVLSAAAHQRRSKRSKKR